MRSLPSQLIPSSVGDPVLGGYLLLFGAAALICFGSLHRARYVDDQDVRVGLMALLITSGVWAISHVGYLASPTSHLRYAFFVVGLVVGLSTVGAWLYFCSAYTGRSYHRNGTVRALAVVTYLSIVAVKITNPIHGWYFTAEAASTPFPHLVIHHLPLHWIVMGLAYALAFVGIFMLFELFVMVDFDTRPLFVLVGLTGLPVVLDLVGSATPYLLDITYSALGVSAFSIGVFYVYFDLFRRVQLAGHVDDPIVILDDEDHVRDVNRSAIDLFPMLETATGSRFGDVLPAVADAIDPSTASESDLAADSTATDDRATTTDSATTTGRTATHDSVDSFDAPDSSGTIVPLDVEGGVRYYRVSENPFSVAGRQLGRTVTLSDVTEAENHRVELERQNERLERFAGVVSHDLRNPLNVAQGRIDLALEGDADDENLLATKRALDRMGVLIEDVLNLARLGRPIDEPERVRVRPIAEESWGMVESGAASLSFGEGFDLTIDADPDRLRQLLENLYRNAVEHGGADVTVRVGELDGDAGFYVEDDGPGIPAEGRDTVFDFGYTTSSDGTGFGLAIVEEIVQAHGWSIRVTESATGGARFEVRTS